MTDRKKLFIIVLTWNRKDLVLRCLSSIKRIVSKKADITIVVVDNHSTDGTLEALKKLRFPMVVIENEDNLGWAGGNNRGIRYALKQGAECLLIINNDIQLEKNSIDILLEVLYSDKKAGIAGAKMLFAGKKSIIADAGGQLTPNRYFGINRGIQKKDTGQYSKVEEVDFVTGITLVKSEVFKEVGLIDEAYYLYYEDTDFCIRARKSGYRVLFNPNAVLYNEFAATVKIGSPTHHYYTTRNHFLFVEKHAPISVKIREWLRIPKTAYEFMVSHDKNKKRYSLLGIRDYLLRRFGKQTYW